MYQLFNNKNKILVVIVASVFYLLPTGASHAATLSFSPASVNVTTGNIVAVKVLVNTDGQSINTVSSDVQFSTDLLQVMSVSKSASIFSLWVQDPTFSNTAGTISFTGGIPNPGFNGQGGEIVSIVFKAKKQGSASVVLSDSSVLLNDGLGTNVMKGAKSAVVNINSASQLDVPTINTSSNSLPIKPLILSSTNPEQDKWYNSTTATFSWDIPSDVSSIKTLLSKDPKAIPTVVYDGSVSQRTVNNLTDGVLYFHLRYINNIGAGPVATYKVQVDATPPEKFTANVTSDGVNSFVTLNANDKTSGIDYYAVGIDSEAAIKVQKDSLINSQYKLPARNAGKHNIEVTAYDNAGNHTEVYSTYVSPEVFKPSIAIYRAKFADAENNDNCQLASVGCASSIDRTESVIVKGSTRYPETMINIAVQPEGKEVKIYTTKTSNDGSYSFLTDPINISGPILVWTEIIFSNGTLGPISDKVKLNVDDSLIVQTSKSIIYSTPYLIFSISLMIGILLILYYGWHKFFGLKRKIRRDVLDLAEDTHKALCMLRDELSNQLSKLEKTRDDRDLNKKEEKIFKELENNIDTIEDFIEKKIKKIK